MNPFLSQASGKLICPQPVSVTNSMPKLNNDARSKPAFSGKKVIVKLACKLRIKNVIITFFIMCWSCY